MNEFPDILQLVCSYLNERGIDYVVVGGVAVMYHGVPRSTVDIDLLLGINDVEVNEFCGFLSENGFAASPEDLRKALREKSHSTMFYLESVLRLDIQGVNSVFDQMTLERAIAVDLFNTRIRIGTAEDTLVNKILFAGEQDIRDALGILERNRERLDFDYIESMCKTLNILDRWKNYLAMSNNGNEE